MQLVLGRLVHGQNELCLAYEELLRKFQAQEQQIRRLEDEMQSMKPLHSAKSSCLAAAEDRCTTVLTGCEKDGEASIKLIEQAIAEFNRHGHHECTRQIGKLTWENAKLRSQLEEKTAQPPGRDSEAELKSVERGRDCISQMPRADRARSLCMAVAREQEIGPFSRQPSQPPRLAERLAASTGSFGAPVLGAAAPATWKC